MNLLDSLCTSQVIQAFGWALLHSLWQGIALAIFLKAALNLPKKISASTRYLFACLTLLSMLLLPVLTALWNDAGKYDVDSGETTSQITKSNEQVLTLPETPIRTNISETESSYNVWLHRAEKQFLPWLVLIWLLGVSVSSLRLMGAWTYIRRLKQNNENLCRIEKSRL